jgi:uncharacterized protein (TIGR03545 family)
MFRWKGIIFLAVVIAIFIILGLIFTDRWLENKMEQLGSSIAGAKVEIDNLDLSLTSLKIHWDRLQVTDRRHTMKNLFETGVCEFDMEFWPLLSKKVIIENFSITDLRTNTDRQSDGKIEKKEEQAPSEPGFLEKTANRLSEQVGSNVGNQFTSFKQKVNVDSIMALLQIQSVSQISALQADLSQNYESWQKRLTQLNYENEIDKLNTQVKAIDINKINTLDGFQAALKSANKIEQSLDSLNKSIKTTRSDLTNDLSRARLNIGQVDDWVKGDYERAMAMAKLPDLNLQNIGKMIFGARLVSQVNQYLKYAATAREYGNKFKSDKPEKQSPPRLKGQNIYFYNKNARPDFWIKNITLSGQTNDGIGLKGEVKNIVSDQRQIGKTTDIFISGSKENAAAIAFNGVLNYLQEQPSELFNLKYSGFSLANTTLSASKLLPNKIQKGTGSVEANFMLQGDQLEGQIKFIGSNLTFDFGDQAVPKNKFDEIVQSIVHSINVIDLVAKIKGTKDDLAFSLNSNLDDLFIKKTKEILSTEVEAAKNKLKARVDAEVTKQRQKLDSLIKEKESQLTAEVEKYEQLIKQQTTMVEAKKKEIEKSITKNKGTLEKKAKDLLKF